MDIDIDDNNDNNYVAALLKDSYCCPVKLLERLIRVKAVVYQIVTSQLIQFRGFLSLLLVLYAPSSPLASTKKESMNFKNYMNRHYQVVKSTSGGEMNCIIVV